ncbi:phospholipid-binding protein MlaC [Limnohabitans sp. Rim8]|jgi:phospholipid transport system substrate-binding protein|uniref:MlaC/ttg2D family ABC transporter substrate-binding protein n=1 Tax=Limnohabitans sp. Rim8 TaxID=1100718 RepID=UPI0025CCA3DF|nr:ABC transporter substrate-binding protein [Limnohabitans sp. Rim8]
MLQTDTALLLNRRRVIVAACAASMLGASGLAVAADEAPEAFIQRITNDTLNAIKADKALRTGDIGKIMQLVDTQLMPHVNFRRMTALATGPAWRKATPEQQKRLQEEFKILLVRTYSGALSQITDQVVVVKPLRAGQEDKNLVVNTEVRGKADPIQLDYRLEKTPGQGAGWMIFDLNVLGVWLIENYRNQFTKEINVGGIDALIASLAARNKSNTKTS